MADKIAWDAGAEVTAEDVMASLKPLFDEYLWGTCEQQGDDLLYTPPRRQGVSPESGTGDVTTAAAPRHTGCRRTIKKGLHFLGGCDIMLRGKYFTEAFSHG